MVLKPMTSNLGETALQLYLTPHYQNELHRLERFKFKCMQS